MSIDLQTCIVIILIMAALFVAGIAVGVLVNSGKPSKAIDFPPEDDEDEDE